MDLLLVWVVMSVIVAALSLLTPRSAWREHRANRKLKREDPPEWRRRQAALRDVF